MNHFPLSAEQVTAHVRVALQEDEAFHDVSTLATILSTRHVRSAIVARREGVIAGVPMAIEAFRQLDPSIAVRTDAPDGTRVKRGDTVLALNGHARGMLSAERTALNYLQHLSGVASLTARFVDAVKGTSAQILDTRKTTPGWRLLEKYAVRCGGGENHRFGLYDEVMVKENHIELAGRPIVDVLRDLRRAVGPGVRITSEARDEKEARAGVEGGADVILLDNMSVAELARLVPLLREQARALGRAVELEASGGIDLSTTQAIAATGVDRLSVGALTHSAPAMDLSLELEPLA